MNENEEMYSLKPLVRPDKNIVFRGKKYPIDFYLLQQNSNYFYKFRSRYEYENNIELFNEPSDISEESIKYFIKSCQNEKFPVNKSNIFSLHQLSIKYDVPLLTKITTEYIQKHDIDIIFQTIKYKQNLQKQDNFDDISLENEEEIIAKDLFKYINKDELVELPIISLYRILNNQHIKIDKQDEEKKKEFIDFIFKSLKKHGKEASILFMNFEMKEYRIEIISKMIDEYSDIIDYGMIDSKFLMKSVFDAQNNIIKILYLNILF